MALLITQTGGGCRASNYIHLLRKALEKAEHGLYSRGLRQSVRPGEEPRLSLDRWPFIRKAGLCHDVRGPHRATWPTRCRPYEVRAGDADAMVAHWTQQLVDGFQTWEGHEPRADAGHL
ncbi:MAG: hypothetical protein ACLUJG_08515 [Lawsonibacter sp.]